ncbi:hypothetical protein [Campylobacter devanensis]|uniref:hypothetical protein n=1 Tax=Campylobacter devanensis TaxID=3161138 RepID=UPI000A34B047|nr:MULTISPECIES: hypothetical protein [unclassified Campylobacter]
MDNRICNIFNQRKILLKNLRTIDIKEFSKKRNYQLFLGIDKSGFYNLIFFRDSKSRFVSKELEELREISELVKRKFDTNIVKFVLFYSSPICSKVLKSNSDWKFYDFM